MTTRRCPYCGEAVPSFSLNCPKCYRSIPREEEKPPEEDIRGKRQSIPDDKALSPIVFNRKIVLLLALVPAAFGVMGMAQMYERCYKRGATFLCVGLPLFIAMVLLIANMTSMGAGGTVLFVGLFIMCLVLFLATYAVQAFDALVRSIFPVSFR